MHHHQIDPARQGTSTGGSPTLTAMDSIPQPGHSEEGNKT